jgi:uncharacterized protein (DUF433 family)
MHGTRRVLQLNRELDCWPILTDNYLMNVTEHNLIPAERLAAGASPIQIVNRGRGPQLSTCRITVQDLVPYLQQNCSPEEIMAIMPVLTIEEILVVQEYVRQNYDAVMEQDRRIRERNAQRTTPPEIEEIRKKGHAKALALMDQFANKDVPEKQGDHAPR